jgi:steroid delta-isomerase
VSIDAGAHVAAFNTAVTSGDWATFSERFADDAVLAFVGPPVGPFAGRDAIAAAYAAQPPDDTISVAGAVTVEGDETVVPYRWDATGATGTMRFRAAPHGLVGALTVTFD